MQNCKPAPGLRAKKIGNAAGENFALIKHFSRCFLNISSSILVHLKTYYTKVSKAGSSLLSERFCDHSDGTPIICLNLFKRKHQATCDIKLIISLRDH